LKIVVLTIVTLGDLITALVAMFIIKELAIIEVVQEQPVIQIAMLILKKCKNVILMLGLATTVAQATLVNGRFFDEAAREAVVILIMNGLL